MAEAAKVGVAQQALAVVSKVKVKYVALPPRRRTSLLMALVGLVALGLGMAWYAGRPDWRVLFSGLEPRDEQQVLQELSAAGIPFQTSSAGVEVPAELLDKARMEVAAKGMPQTGRLGFELFDKPNWVGSEFDERVNYQRALEGELEHTITTLGVVRSARVHLVLPQKSLFATEDKQSKASVVLKLKRGSLDPEQADSIRNLVAGAVENLSPDQVTLVDADGRINLQARGLGAHQGEVEQALETKLIAMLEPLAGIGNVRATVNVSYDEGSEERTDEVYDPAQSVALTTQKTEQTMGGAKSAQGVPGTASNSPGAAPTGAIAGSAAAAAPGTPPLLEKSALPVFPNGGSQSQTRREESGTYAVTRHLSHTEQGPGRVRRVTAAVVVNDRQLREGTGKAQQTAWKPRTAEEMHRLEGLAQAAVGFDEKRGDQVVIENVGFSANTPEPQAAGVGQVVEQARGLLQNQPGLGRTLVLGLVSTLLIWFVLRPVAGQVVATLKEPALLSTTTVEEVRTLESAAAASRETEGLAPEQLPDPVPAPIRRRTPLAQTNTAVFEQVSEHIRREPGQSTRLLEAWIGAEEAD